MTSTHPRIAVIGSGILGSAIAYNLAIRGADVQLIDEGPAPGSGVTGRAFGWVNTINGAPDHANYPLWREAIAEYRRLGTALPEALADARPGSVMWEARAEETEEFAALRLSAGENVELLAGRTLAEWEPRLRNVPDCAVFSPDDLALDPARLAASLAAAAVSAGASVRFDTKALALETANGRLTGVRLSEQILPADITIMAAAGGINALAGGVGIDVGVTTSPALLMRYACSAPVVSRILCGPRLEIRQARDNTIFVAKSYADDGGQDGARLIGERMLAVMREEFDIPEYVNLVSAAVGHRPVFADGLPRLGFLPGIEGLYVAVGHPGVILAPLIGRLAADEILDGKRTDLIPDPRNHLSR